MDNYIILFELKVYQEYLANYSMKDFNLVLTEQSLKILSSYQLRVKKISQGFLVFGSSRSAELIKTAREELIFDFGFNIESSHFGSYTNLELNNLSNKYFINNRKGTVLTTHEVSTLHHNDFLSLEDKIECVYPYTDLSNVFGVIEIEIYRDDEKIFSGSSENLFLSSILADDFGNLIVKVLDTEVEINLYYCASILANCFCVAEINLKELTSTESNVASFFEVKFENRAVLWNYIFVSRRVETIYNVKILDGKNELNFGSLSQILLPNGHNGYQLSSQEPFPLQREFNNLRMVAEIQVDEENKLDNKRIKLPTPDVKKIKGIRNEENEEVYYCNMYVYY